MSEVEDVTICSFNRDDAIRRCDQPVSGKGRFCKDHSERRCYLCGKTATRSIVHFTGLEIMNWDLCLSNQCELEHLYRYQPDQALPMILTLEQTLRTEPRQILIAKTISDNDALNMKYKAGFVNPNADGTYSWSTILLDIHLKDAQRRIKDMLHAIGDNRVVSSVDSSDRVDYKSIPVAVLDSVAIKRAQAT